MASTGNRKARSGGPQQRGVKRRQQLRDAALMMMASQDFSELSYQAIADQAGIPLASCYNFFNSKLDLVRDIGEVLTDQYKTNVLKTLSFDGIDNWQACVEHYVRATVRYHKKSVAELQIYFSGEIPMKVRLDSVRREKEIGQWLLASLQKKFRLPKIDQADDIFFRSIELGRTILALEFQASGELDEASVAEASRAMTGYLSHYLPAVLVSHNP